MADSELRHQALKSEDATGFSRKYGAFGDSLAFNICLW